MLLRSGIVTTRFHIENKDFTEHLKITVKDKEYYFCDNLTIEYNDCDTLSFDVELVRTEEYQKVKNPFLRFLVNILKWVISILVYFCDNEGGIRLDKGYKSFNPFTLKKSFSINAPDKRRINITYIEPAFDKMTKKYTPPRLEISENVVTKTEAIEFSPLLLKREWNIYHIPAFVMIMIIVSLLLCLHIVLFVNAIRDIALYSMSENVWSFIGMSFCSLAMIALVVAYIIIIVKAYKLYKSVEKENM